MLQPIISIPKSQQTHSNRTPTGKILYGTGVMLVSTVWLSAGLFGLYILAFYASALYQGSIDRWNNMLPGLYTKNSSTATSGIGLHFAMGGIILMLGNIQLVEKIRQRKPALHRWVGRVYVTACLLAGVGGLVFILAVGTIGGTVMNIGFGLYGVLMILAAVQTWRHAVAKQLNVHRAWALRLYALAIGSWLYRMDYGFWLLLANGWGHQHNFAGPFDRVMAFFFYLPNLLVAEAFIRAKKNNLHPVINIFSCLMIVCMTAFIILGSYYFTKFYWGPAIVAWFTGAEPKF